MLRTPTANLGMPLFGSVEPEARRLRPLKGYSLAAPSLLSRVRNDAPGHPARFLGRSSPLLGGVAVLAVAGALSAGLGAGSNTDVGIQAVPAAAAVAAPAAAPLTGLDALLRPVAYVVPMKAPATTGTLAVVAGVKAHSPSVRANANAPHGAAVVTHLDTVSVQAMRSDLRRLRTCESGGNYREASGNGYWGAYQFDLTTWRSLGLSGYPSNASHQLQDVAVVRLQARKGWGPWPVCSYVAGLR